MLNSMMNQTNRWGAACATTLFLLAGSVEAQTAIPVVQRTPDGIELAGELTRTFLGNSFEFDFYRNNTYECGLTGSYSFLVVNPINGDENTEAPLWVYLHGGGSGYFDENGDYFAVGNQDENTWNHEETMDDLIANPLQLNTIGKNGQLKDTTLTRRILEGYRVALVGMCDHDQYLGLGTPYPNNPNAPKEVNGMQATMAAIDYIAANHPTTHVFAHGTSAGSVGAYALALSYSAEDIGLTGVVSDSVLSERGKLIQEVLAGTPGFPQQEGFDPAGVDEKVGLYRLPENQTNPEARIAAGFNLTPLLFVGGLSDPQCGFSFPTLPEAVADGFDNNCEWEAAQLIETINAQPDSPHEVALFEGEGHVPTNNVTPANDKVDEFIGEILAGNPAPPFGDPSTGACCMSDTGCSIMTAFECSLLQKSTYYGDGSSCDVGTTCEPCVGDITGDRNVDSSDIGILLALWNTSARTNPEADINSDGTVNAADLGILLGAWGVCP